MAKKEYLQRYILIVELLRRKEVSFPEIQEYLFQNDIEISQRTFQRDKEEIDIETAAKAFFRAGNTDSDAADSYCHAGHASKRHSAS